MTALVWFRRDLRAHDHPALRAALDAHDEVVPFFCFDDRLLHGRHAPGPRTQFLLECLQDLASSVPLVILRGRPEEEIPKLARRRRAGELHFTADVSPFARRRRLRDLDCVGHPGLNVVATTPSRWSTTRPPGRRPWSDIGSKARPPAGR